MSIEPEPVEAARVAVRAVIEHVRQAGHQDEPAVLMRVGALDTRLASVQALAGSDSRAATLLAAHLIRAIAHDFPGLALPPLDLVEEQRAYRALATRLLSAQAAV